MLTAWPFMMAPVALQTTVLLAVSHDPSTWTPPLHTHTSEFEQGHGQYTVLLNLDVTLFILHLANWCDVHISMKLPNKLVH